jgi:small ligand-binding sensory domain FIST
MNGKYQLVVYAEGINLLRNNINTIEKNTEALIDASKKIGLMVNTFVGLEDGGDMFLRNLS